MHANYPYYGIDQSVSHVNGTEKFRSYRTCEIIVSQIAYSYLDNRRRYLA